MNGCARYRTPTTAKNKISQNEIGPRLDHTCSGGTAWVSSAAGMTLGVEIGITPDEAGVTVAVTVAVSGALRVDVLVGFNTVPVSVAGGVSILLLGRLLFSGSTPSSGIASSAYLSYSADAALLSSTRNVPYPPPPPPPPDAWGERSVSDLDGSATAVFESSSRQPLQRKVEVMCVLLAKVPCLIGYSLIGLAVYGFTSSGV
ncbi:hypothetical protein VTK56DRAFT_1610 [Thermocarpiscus australiensis]